MSAFTELAAQVKRQMAELPDCCDEQGYTYLVGGADSIKIGYSRDPSDRIVSLQTGSPVPLSLLYLARGNREAGLHSRCHDHRRHGEWFDAAGVRAELAEAFRKMGPYALCLGCAVYMADGAAERRRIARTAPTIEFRACSRGHDCYPTCWYTADGRVELNYHGDLGCKRTLRMAERLGKITPEQIADLGDHEPLPAKIAEMAQWIPGCLRCGVLDGSVARTREVAYAIMRFSIIDDELRRWGSGVIRGEVAA